MGNNLIILAIFSIGILLVLRGYMSMGIRICLAKKDRKLYTANVSVIDRWFFWTAPKIVKDKYAKSEKKRIPYSSMVKAYRAVNLVMHIALTAESVSIFCYAFGFVPELFLNWVCAAYFVASFLSFVLLTVIDLTINSRYHRSRYGH